MDPLDVLEQLDVLRSIHERTTQRFTNRPITAPLPEPDGQPGQLRHAGGYGAASADATASDAGSVTPMERRDRIRAMLRELSPSRVTATMRQASAAAASIRSSGARTPAAMQSGRIGVPDDRAAASLTANGQAASAQGEGSGQVDNDAGAYHTPTHSQRTGNATSSPQVQRTAPSFTLDHPPWLDSAERRGHMETPLFATREALPSPRAVLDAPQAPLAAEFRFGGQQVFVSGPPMHQQLQIHPDGSLSTLHTPYPQAQSPRAQLEHIPATPVAPPSATRLGLVSTLMSPHLSPSPGGSGTGPADDSSKTWQLQPGDGELLAKYKRAKKLLQAQLHENEGLRRQLAGEAQRAAVLEAKMGALSSPAEVSGMLAHSQADKLVAISKFHETNAQLEHLRGNAHMLQVQVAAAVTERQQLIEAFTFERAKREAEALTLRRGLEGQLEDMGERLRASERAFASQAPKELAMQARVSELEALISGLETSSRELQAAKEEVELDLRVLKHKLVALEEDGAQRAQDAAAVAALEEEGAQQAQGAAAVAALQLTQRLEATILQLRDSHSVELQELQRAHEEAVALLLEQQQHSLKHTAEQHQQQLADARAKQEELQAEELAGVEAVHAHDLAIASAQRAQRESDLAAAEVAHQEALCLLREGLEAAAASHLQQCLASQADSHASEMLAATQLVREQQVLLGEQLHAHAAESRRWIGTCKEQEEAAVEARTRVEEEAWVQLQQLEARLRAEHVAEAAAAEGGRLAAETRSAELQQEVAVLEACLEEQRDSHIAALDALQSAHEASILQLMLLNREAVAAVQRAHEGHQRRLEEEAGAKAEEVQEGLRREGEAALALSEQRHGEDLDGLRREAETALAQSEERHKGELEALAAASAGDPLTEAALMAEVAGLRAALEEEQGRRLKAEAAVSSSALQLVELELQLRLANEAAQAASEAAEAKGEHHKCELAEIWRKHLAQVKTFQAQLEAAAQSALEHAEEEQRMVASLLASHAVEEAMLGAAWQVHVAAASKEAEHRVELQDAALFEAEGKCADLRAACVEMAQSLKAVQSRNEELAANQEALRLHHHERELLYEKITAGQEALKLQQHQRDLHEALTLHHHQQELSEAEASPSADPETALHDEGEVSLHDEEYGGAAGSRQGTEEDDNSPTGELEERMAKAGQRADMAEEAADRMKQQLQDLRSKYSALQEDLDTSMAESEGYAEQLALAQHQLRQYEAQIQQYERDLDSAAEDLELMHGRALEAKKQAEVIQCREPEKHQSHGDGAKLPGAVKGPPSDAAVGTRLGAERLAATTAQQQQLQREVQGLTAQMQQLRADLRLHQQEAAAEVADVVKRSRTQIGDLGLELRLLSRQAHQQLAEHEETLAIKLVAREGMVQELQAHLSQARSSVDEGRTALRMAQAAMARSSEEVRELHFLLEDQRQEAEASRLEAEAARGRVSELSRQVSRFRQVCSGLEEQLAAAAGQARHYEAELSRSALELSCLREGRRETQVEAKRAKGGAQQQERSTVKAVHNPVAHGANETAASASSLSAVFAVEAGVQGLPPLMQRVPLSAADLEGLVEDVAHDCRHLASVDGLLLALEIYSAAAAVSSPHSMSVGSGGRRHSAAAVRAAAAASGVSEEELAQLLSPSGQELVHGYEEAVRLALQEVLRAREMAAAAGAHAVGARLEGYEVRLRDSQRRIREAAQTIRAAPAEKGGAGPLATVAARHNVAGEAAAGGLTHPPAPITAALPGSSASPSADHQASPAPTPPGSSPPAPRQWAWPGAPLAPPLTGGAPPFAPAGGASWRVHLHRRDEWQDDELPLGDGLPRGGQFPTPLPLKAALRLPMAQQPRPAPAGPRKALHQQPVPPAAAATVCRRGSSVRPAGFSGSTSEATSSTSRRRNSREQQPVEEASAQRPSRLSLSVNGRPLRTSSDLGSGSDRLLLGSERREPPQRSMPRAPGEHVLGPEFGLLRPEGAGRHTACEASGPPHSFAPRAASPLPSRRHQISSVDAAGYAAAYQRQKRATGGTAGA